MNVSYENYFKHTFGKPTKANVSMQTSNFYQMNKDIDVVRDMSNYWISNKNSTTNKKHKRMNDKYFNRQPVHPVGAKSANFEAKSRVLDTSNNHYPLRQDEPHLNVPDYPPKNDKNKDSPRKSVNLTENSGMKKIYFKRHRKMNQTVKSNSQHSVNYKTSVASTLTRFS